MSQPSAGWILISCPHKYWLRNIEMSPLKAHSLLSVTINPTLLGSHCFEGHHEWYQNRAFLSLKKIKITANSTHDGNRQRKSMIVANDYARPRRVNRAVEERSREFSWPVCKQEPGESDCTQLWPIYGPALQGRKTRTGPSTLKGVPFSTKEPVSHVHCLCLCVTSTFTLIIM